MGTYENQLKAITSGPRWNIEQLDTFKAEMVELQELMKTIAASPGWTGTSADEAREKFAAMRKEFGDIETKLAAARDAIKLANEALTRADNKLATLPSVWIPDWLYAAAAAAVAGTMIKVPFVGEFRAEVVIQRVQEFFGSQREAEAHTALTTLTGDLVTPRRELQAARVDPDSGDGRIEWPEEVPEPGGGVTWHGDDYGNGAWSTGGGGGGGSLGTGKPYAPRPPVVTLPPNCPPGWPGPTIGVDGNTSSGTIGGGGFGGGLLGAGAGIGGLAAASKLAKGGLGAGGMFGGAGAGGAGGVSVAGGMGGGAGSAGGRSSAMMGGGAPGGGGGSEKEKRHGLGLIAPKLEDDEETGPRSAAAGAGGRE